MTKCPKCGKEVPKKGWTMAGKPDEKGKRTDVTFGLCQECSLIVITRIAQIPISAPVTFSQTHDLPQKS